MSRVWSPKGRRLSIWYMDNGRFLMQQLHYLAELANRPIMGDLLLEVLTEWFVNGILDDYRLHTITCARFGCSESAPSAAALNAAHEAWQYLTLLAAKDNRRARFMLEEILKGKYEFYARFADAMRSLRIAESSTECNGKLLVRLLRQEYVGLYNAVRNNVMCDIFSGSYSVGASLYTDFAGEFHSLSRATMALYFMNTMALGVVESVAAARKIKSAKPVDKKKLKQTVIGLDNAWQLLKGMSFGAIQNLDELKYIVRNERADAVISMTCTALIEGLTFLLEGEGASRSVNFESKRSKLSQEVFNMDTLEIVRLLKTTQLHSVEE